MIVSRVRSNVKGGVDAVLGERTLIVGANGSGKDALLASVELALLGRVSDLAGKRDVGAGLDLWQLAPEGAGMLWSEVEFSDGTTCRWEIKGGDGKTTGQKHNPPDALLLPLRELRQELSASDDRARAYLLRSIGSAVDSKAVLQEIPAALHAAVKGLSCDTPSVHDLQFVAGEAAKRARQAKKDGEAAEQALTAGPVGKVPTDAEIEELRAVNDAAQAALAQARERADEARRLQAGTTGAARERAEAEAMVARLEAEMQRAEASLATAREDVARMAQWRTSASPLNVDEGYLRATVDYWTLVAAVAERQLGAPEDAPCFCCGSVLASPHGTAEANLKAARGALAQVEGQRAEIAQREHHAAQEAAMTEKLRSFEGQTTTWLAQTRAHVEHLRAKLAAPPVDMPVVNLSEASLAVEAAADRAMAAKSELGLALGMATTLANRQRHLEAKARAAEDRARYEQVAEACAAAGIALLTNLTAKFVKRARSYMPTLPDGAELDVKLRDGKRDICRVGLRIGESFRTALSGAEWNIVTTAIAQAIAEGHTGPAVIIPEERAYDAVTLGRWMRALSNAPAQVLLASPIVPSGRTPAKWSIVQTSEFRPGEPAADQPDLLPSATAPEA